MVTKTDEKKILCGKRLKECRKRMGYTQQKLTELIEKLPENNGKIRNEKHLSSVERGLRSLSIEYASLISKVLLVRKEYLLGYDDFMTGLDETRASLNDYGQKYACINFLISRAGYSEISKSNTRYQQLYISSDDTEDTINKKIDFAKRRLDTTPEYDVIYADTKGRKIHLTSSELDKIYDDIEFFIRYRLEKEFDNVTRYKYKEDNPTWI
nr:MAG TPA: dUTPase, Orf20, Repressor, Complex, STRUCTURAL PROTEIN [Caudoviricetes sp.]